MNKSEYKEIIKNKAINIITYTNPKTLKELVEILEKETNINKNIIIEYLIKLNQENIIVLKNNNLSKPNNIKEYFLSKHSHWFWIVSTATIISFLTTIILNDKSSLLIYLRHILGTFLVIFLPGYSVSKIFFLSKQISKIERVLLSITLSIIIVPLLGLTMNYVNWNINIISTTTIIILITLISSFIAALREYQTIIQYT